MCLSHAFTSTPRGSIPLSEEKYGLVCVGACDSVKHHLSSVAPEE